MSLWLESKRELEKLLVKLSNLKEGEATEGAGARWRWGSAGALKASGSSGPQRICMWISVPLLPKVRFAFQIPYIETSAKDPPLNVDKAFHDLVRVIR